MDEQVSHPKAAVDTKRNVHITQIRAALHLLPVRLIFDIKILLLDLKALNGPVLSYGCLLFIFCNHKLFLHLL